jgi:hypothetical protein
LGVGAFVEFERECVCVCCDTMRVHDGDGGLGCPLKLESWLLFIVGTGVCSRGVALEEEEAKDSDNGGWFDENTSAGTPSPMMLVLLRN